MSVRKTVVLTTRSKPDPAASSTARRFSSTCMVCSAAPTTSIVPERGLIGSWPAQYTTPFASTACA